MAQECTTKYGAVQSVMIFEVTTPGFPPEQAVRIFVEFERVEEATKVGRTFCAERCSQCTACMQHASSYTVIRLFWKFVRASELLQAFCSLPGRYVLLCSLWLTAVRCCS